MGVSSSYNSETKVWSGPKIKNNLFHPDASFGQVIYGRIKINPKNILQINHTEGISFTNEQVLSMSIKVALSLLDLDLKQTDFIGIMSSNTSYLMPLCYGSCFAAIPFHPVDVSFDKEVVSHCWGKSRPKIIFCDASVYDLVKSVVDDLDLNAPIYILKDRVEGVKHIEDMFVDRGNQELFYKPSQISSGNQTAVILCSSGSTGPPKAVTISHNVMKTIGSNFSGTCEEVSLSFTSLFWISGLNNMISTAMTGATRLVSCEPFNAELCLELIDKYKATKATFLPMHLAAINASPARFTKSMKSLNIIFSSGAPLPCETLNNFKEILSPNCRIIQGFACTEKGAITMDLYGKADGSCGTVAPNVEVKIIDNNGHSLGPNENGEIVARNFHPWKGYYNDEETTREVYDLETDWYRTGDMGHFNENGDLFIVDRIKEIFKSKGFHISPSEIEFHIMTLKGVSEVCVVGIPDVLTAGIPTALVIKEKDSIINEDDILKHISGRLPDYKHLRGGVFFVDEIPRTVSGKLLRRKARILAEELYHKCNR